jgi:hypothetical protein
VAKAWADKLEALRIAFSRFSAQDSYVRDEKRAVAVLASVFLYVFQACA